MKGFVFLLSLLVPCLLRAQPVADFSVPSSVCIDQLIKPVNNSTGSVMEWDFCQGDLSFVPSSELSALAAGSANLGIDIVSDGTSWFGFVTDASNNTIIRLDYGANINSAPTVTSLGAIYSDPVIPYDIEIVYDNGQWYGFVYGVGRVISRLDFGTSLTNTPTTEVLVTDNGSTSGLDMVFANGNWHIVYTRFYITTVIKLSTITSTPGVSDIVSADLSDTSYQLGDITVLENNGSWFAYSPSYQGNHTLQRFSFGNTLFSTPTIDDITGAVVATVTPYGIDGAFDNGKNVLLISALDGTIVRVDLGSDLSSAPSGETSLTNFGMLNSTLKIILRKIGSEWSAYTIAYNSGQTFRLTFPAPACHSSIITSAAEVPVFSYDAPGTYYVTLRSYDHGSFSEKSLPIVVQDLLVPELSIEVDGVCLANPTNLSITSSLPITSATWDLGNSTSSSDTNPSLTYGGAGDYDVQLEATADNGCIGVATKIVSIFNPPNAAFNLPNPATVCTNQEYVFTNTTTFDAGSQPTWEWSKDGTVLTNTEDLSASFSTATDYSIKLVAAIPGCSSEITKVFSVLHAGPTVDFSMTGNCQLTDVELEDLTTGAESSLTWDFGDGGTSNDANTTHSFANIGTYDVALTVTNTAGCANSTTKPITIYSLPSPAFSLDLPPFSCSGTPSQFHDTTPSMTDSNVQSWDWTFGDSNSGTGKNPTNTYTSAGDYTVRLLVTTDFGCSSFVDQPVTIAQSPIAAFTHDPTCIDQPTHFNDTSTGAAAWQWQIGSTSYTTQNLIHTFSSTGDTHAQLTVTSQNNCTNTISVPLVVPVAPTVDFQYTNPCSGLITAFNDVTTNFSDPIEQHDWSFNGTTATGSNATFTFTDSGTYPVELELTAHSGCVYSVTKQVQIFTTPIAAFTMSDESGPPPLHVVFTNASVGATSYSWDFHDGNQPITTASPEYTYPDLGDYNLDMVATGPGGCQNATSASISVIVPYNELALEGLTLIQPAGSGAYRGYITIKNNGNYRIDGFVVTYDIGGGIKVRENVVASIHASEERVLLLSSEFLEPASASFICAELDDDHNLSDNKICTTFNDSSIIFDVNPNPATTYVNVQSILPAVGTVRARIYNMSGSVSYDRTFDVGTGLSNLSLDVQDLSAGVYIIVITSGTASTSQRILIAR